MNYTDVLKPRLPTLIGTVALTAVFIALEAKTIASNCAAVTCLAGQPSGWIAFSVFPHCCGSYSLFELALEYVLLVLAPLLISYVIIAIGVWAWENRR